MARHAQPGQNPPIHTAYHQPSGPGDTHGIEIRGTSDTRGQVQQQVEADVDHEIDGKGFWPRLFATLTRDNTVQNRVDSQMNDQASALGQGVQTRTPPAMSCSNYQACPHPDLKTMVTEQVSPETVGDMGELWINAGNQMVAFQSEVAGAISNSEADWRGTGGDAARRFMSDIGNWVGQAGQSAQLAGTQAQRYSGALSTAKNSMPEPVDFDVDQANAELNKTTDPIAYMAKYSSFMAKYQAQQDAHLQAVQVLGIYDSNLGGASTMPAFAAPPAMSGHGTGSDTPGGNPGEGERQGEPGTVAGGHTGTSTGSGPGTGSGTGAGTGSGPGTGTGPGGTGPGVGSGPGTGPGTGAGVLPGGRPPSIGTTGQGYTPAATDNPLSGLNNPGAMPIAPGMGFGPGGSGFGGGGAGGGIGGSTGGGAGGSSRGGLSGGTAGRGGSVGPVGGLAAEQAAARGGATSGRGAGTGGMGGMGAGRGQGGEDDEHERPSYLVEPDPESTFGTDEMTAPPVIGA
jgi:hypothetical protein